MGYKTAVDGTRVFATRILRLGQDKFLHYIDGYEEMAVNAAPSGSLSVAWNGNGPADPGGDWDATGKGSQTTAAAHSGNYGWDTGIANKNHTTVLTAPEDLDIDDAYGTMSFWMQPKLYPIGAVLRVWWEDEDGNQVGTRRKISDYVSDFDINIWQKVSIPIEDFSVNNAIVRKLVFAYTEKNGQHFYFDDISLVHEGGGLFKFTVSAAANEAWHVHSINLVLSAGTSGWSSDAFATISDGLTDGVLIRQIDNDGYESPILWSINLKTNVDLFGRLELLNDIDFFDGEHLVTMALKPTPASVVLSGNNVINILLRDNLSSLNKFRAFIHYGVEDIT
jgi:hypothetical protein